ncbi:MAG: porin family protein [Gammaproteobacteria bacterium]|nr:porin family protein [Gammaproteobacteria bacterium]MBU1480036.1 porin family protein [Gammaproteobacteria bacterium]
MNLHIIRWVFALLLLSATQAYAGGTFVVSGMAGGASPGDGSGYNNSTLVRLDGGYFLLPEFGFNLSVANYNGFKTSGSGTEIDIKITGGALGVVGKWPVHPHVQPYVRLDYMRWNAEATGLNRTLGKDQGGSAGLAVGVQVPIKKIFGAKAEVSGYNNVSGVNIRQIAIGWVLEF